MQRYILTRIWVRPVTESFKTWRLWIFLFKKRWDFSLSREILKSQWNLIAGHFFFLSQCPWQWKLFLWVLLICLMLNAGIFILFYSKFISKSLGFKVCGSQLCYQFWCHQNCSHVDIKTTFKDSTKELEKRYKMEFLFVFPAVTKAAYFWWKCWCQQNSQCVSRDLFIFSIFFRGANA